MYIYCGGEIVYFNFENKNMTEEKREPDFHQVEKAALLCSRVFLLHWVTLPPN